MPDDLTLSSATSSRFATACVAPAWHASACAVLASAERAASAARPLSGPALRPAGEYMTAVAAQCFSVPAATPEAVALTLSAVTAAVALEAPPWPQLESMLAMPLHFA